MFLACLIEQASVSATKRNQDVYMVKGKNITSKKNRPIYLMIQKNPVKPTLKVFISPPNILSQ